MHNREHTQTEEREILEQPDKIKETTPLSTTEPLPQKCTPKDSWKSRASGNAKTNKESPKMGRQKKNQQSERIEESPVKKQNEMEASNLSDIGLKRIIVRVLKQLIDKYKELSGNYNSMKKERETTNELGRNEEYNI